MNFAVTILVPVADNDGNEFPRTRHDSFLAHLVEVFGAYTEEPGRYRGGWSHEGKVYLDECIGIVVAISSLEQGSEVVAAARYAATHYEQLAIAIRYAGMMEIVNR